MKIITNQFIQKIYLILILIFSCSDSPMEAVVHGCLDSQACNYDPTATHDNNSCLYLDECDECGGDGIDEGFCDCSGNVEDCAGFCDGTAVKDCAGVCEGTAVEDECGVCEGSGIPDGECDCGGNVEDCAGVCGGDAALDECGVCNGDGPAQNFDCDGNCIVDIDCLDECGGDAVVDECGECNGLAECICDNSCPSILMSFQDSNCDNTYLNSLGCTNMIELDNQTSNQTSALYNTSANITGFQFDIVNMENINSFDHSDNFIIQISEPPSIDGSRILGYSLSGDLIPGGCGVLITLFHNSNESENFQISNIIFTDDTLNADLSPNLIDICHLEN